MDLSDLGRHAAAAAGAAPAPGSVAAVERLQALLAQIGADVAGPLTAAIERINTLAGTGRIERDSLRALREEVEAARQAGMIGQQLTRFTSGRIRQSHEKVPLADTVAHLLSHRQREIQARGVTVTPVLAPVDVVVDASLLFGLLNSTVDWALANTASTIDIAVQTRAGTALARLACRFRQRPADEAVDGPNATLPRSRDSLVWRLIEQTAWAMGLHVERREEDGVTLLEVDFPRGRGTHAEIERTLDANDGFAASINSRPLAGSHLLVIASRREMRVRVRDALRRMSLIVDFVNSVDEAAAFCREGLPHAIVIEAIQSGERFARFRQDICAEVRDFVFIEIVEEGSVFQMSGPGGAPARIGRDVMADSLPAALVFELSKGA